MNLGSDENDEFIIEEPSELIGRDLHFIVHIISASLP